MEKIKDYDYVRFTVEVLKEGVARLTELAARRQTEVKEYTLTVEHEDSVWKYDVLEEFFADYRINHRDATMHLRAGAFAMVVWAHRDYTRVSVEGETRADVEIVYSVFEASSSKCQIPKPKIIPSTPTIFIGHGHSGQWKELKDHLHEKHGFKIEAYESGARAGHTIRDILEEMVLKSSFALLVLTAEDEQPDGKFRARQNIIHEAGLFQGRLGFPRAILLLEEGVEEFSNVHGVQYIRFSNGRIRETFGEVLATLRREFSR